MEKQTKEITVIAVTLVIVAIACIIYFQKTKPKEGDKKWDDKGVMWKYQNGVWVLDHVSFATQLKEAGIQTVDASQTAYMPLSGVPIYFTGGQLSGISLGNSLTRN